MPTTLQRKTTETNGPARSAYLPPLDGAFTIVTTSMKVLMIQSPHDGFWELPGGGQEEKDVDLRHTATRESREEAKVQVDETALAHVADLIQRVPKRGPDATGTVRLFQAQVFLFPYGSIDEKTGVVGNTRLKKPETTEEASCIRFIHVGEIFGGDLQVRLGHKRMILHWINWCDKSKSPTTGMKLSDPVTAQIPGWEKTPPITV